MRSAERGKEAYRLAPRWRGEPLGFRRQRVEQHGHRVGGRRRADEAVKFLDGDVVRVAVGELGERGEHAGLELRHRRVLRRRRASGPGGGARVQRLRGGGRPGMGFGGGFGDRGGHCGGFA